jgi:hypothetical protein
MIKAGDSISALARPSQEFSNVAIQFKCPACDAMIRVPDSSAGKKGTCPQCSEKLIVPNVAQGKTASIAGPAISPPSRSAGPKNEAPHVGMPHIDLSGKRPTAPPAKPASVAPKLEIPQFDSTLMSPSAGINIRDEGTAALPELGLPPVADEATPSLAQTLAKKEQQKKKARKMGWVVPAVCGAILLGVLGIFSWVSQPKLEGQLTAQVIPEMETPPTIIPALQFVNKGELQEILERLKSGPTEWNSNTARFKLAGTPDGATVSLRPGREMHFVVVRAIQNKALVDFIKSHSDDLDKPRQAAIKKQAPQFLDDWYTHLTEKTPMKNQATYRDEVLFPSLVTGVGYHLEAVVKGTRYPCIYEDGDNGLYFLLPNGTKSFVLRGRRVSGGASFPANYTVDVEGTTDAPATTKKKNTAKTKEERESENQGMNPELYKKETKPASEADAVKAGLGNLLAPGSRASNTKPTTPTKPKTDMMDEDSEMMEKPKTKPKK